MYEHFLSCYCADCDVAQFVFYTTTTLLVCPRAAWIPRPCNPPPLNFTIPTLLQVSPLSLQRYSKKYSSATQASFTQMTNHGGTRTAAQTIRIATPFVGSQYPTSAVGGVLLPSVASRSGPPFPCRPTPNGQPSYSVARAGRPWWSTRACRLECEIQGSSLGRYLT